jgi:hypothetical protein
MDKLKAIGVMKMLDKIGMEIDILGKILIHTSLEPKPVRVRNYNPPKFK